MNIARRCLLACSLAAVLLAGCGRSGPWQDGDLLALRIEPASLQLYLQQTVQLEVRGTFLEWDEQEGWGQVVQEVTGEAGLSLWSSDSAVVRVLDGARLFAVAAGTTRVNAWWQGRLVSIPVEVRYALLAGLDAQPPDLQLAVGDYRQLQVVGRLTDGSEVDLSAPALGTSYSIDNHATAAVTREGIVFGLSDGVAQVHVEHGRLEDTVAVVVGTGRRLEAIAVAPERLQLQPGGSGRVQVVGLWSDGSSEDLTGDAETTLSSSDTQVARVAADGLVTALAPGQATIEAGYRQFGASALVEVKEQDDVNPLPRLDSVSPAQVAAGSGPVTILAGGAGFVQQSRLYLDGRQLATTWRDASHLQATVDASYTTTAGKHHLWVENPAPGGGSSARLDWLVVVAPRVDSLLPSQAIAGSSVRLLFQGAGFAGCHPESSSPAVSFSHPSVAADGDRLWVTATIDGQAPAGDCQLLLVNAGGQAAAGFEITRPATPEDLVIQGPATVMLSGVQYYRNIVIGTGARVMGVGDEPLQLLATGNVEIYGEIDARGHNGQVGYLEPAAGGDAGPGGGGGGGGADGDGPQAAAGGAGSPPGQAAAEPAGAGTGSGSGGGDGAGEGIAGGCAQAGGGGGLAGGGGAGGGDAGAGSGGRGGRRWAVVGRCRRPWR